MKTILHNIMAPLTYMNKSNAIFIWAIVLIFFITSLEHVDSQSTTQDDCPEVDGDSTEDRFGCLDSDGDGWSNPDEDWTINNGADAFISDNTQWKDLDRDGYGDNATIGANNIDYWPNDRLRHKPVLLIACEPASNTIILSERSSFFCKVTNPMDSISVNLRIEWQPQEGISSEWSSREVTLQANGEQGHLTMFSINNIGIDLGLSGGEVQLWVQNQESPSAIAKLPILVIKEYTVEENEFNEDVSKAFSFSRMHDGVKQVAIKIEETSGVLFPTWVIYLTLTIMFSLSLKKPAKVFSKTFNNKNPTKKVIEKPVETYEEPPIYVVKRRNNMERTPKEDPLESDSFDYVPKRLR